MLPGMGRIVVAAICFVRTDGRVLTVRKRGTRAYMLPGGKIEPGESALECAVREVDEELGIRVRPDQVAPLGTFETRAANERGFALEATVFRCDLQVAPRLQAELDDLRWVDPGQAVDDPLEAPLNREHIFPLLLARSR